MQHVVTRTRTFKIQTSIGRALRVKADANLELSVAGAAEVEVGTMERSYLAEGLGHSGVASVVLANAQGTRECVANGAIAVGAEVAAAADGKVAAGTGYGIALTAAAADGDIIEVLKL